MEREECHITNHIVRYNKNDPLKTAIDARKLQESCCGCDQQGVKSVLAEDRNTAEKANEFFVLVYAAKGIGEKHTRVILLK